MLVKAGLVLLCLWLVGMIGIYDGGELTHVLLLVGLLLLMMGALKAREAAPPTGRSDPADKR